MAFDVVVIGSVGIDTNVFLKGADIDFNVEANFTDNYDYVGQAGGYVARGYSHLGKQTAFVGYVGDDFSGRHVRETLAGDGIDLSALEMTPAGTNRSVNFMYRDGRRKNFYDGKDHMTAQPNLELSRRVLAGAKLAHFNLPNWARKLLPEARRAGVKIACDIQDVIDPNDPYRLDFVGYADILFFSAVNHGDPAPLIRHFLSQRPERIVISGMGAQGCALGTKDGIRYFPPIAMDERPVVDTNGAGDGLSVGFLTSYVLDGYSLEDSARRGQIVGRYTCSLKADTDGLIRREALDAYDQRFR